MIITKKIRQTSRDSIIVQMKKEAINIINNTRILIDNDKLYIIANVNKFNTKEDFIAECLKYYYLSKEISTQDVQLRHVTIKSVIKESEAQDGEAQRIHKRYRFTNLNLGTTVYALELK